MAAIHVLNDDTLISVFLQFQGNANTSFKFALVLSHICSRWRALVVEHCPELWRFHALRVPRSPQDLGIYASGNLSSFNKELIRRSQSLDLEFGWYEVLPSASAFGALLEAADQLGSLELSYPIDERLLYIEHSRELPGMKTAHAPCLKHLELANFKRDLSTSIFRGGDLPNLRSLSLANTGLYIQKMKFAATLKELRASGTESLLEHWPQILQHTPQLTTLYLDLAHDDIPPSLAVNLPHLVHLDITAPIAVLVPFLSRFSLPVCRKVRFNACVPYIHFDMDASIGGFIREVATRYSIDTPSGSRLRIQRRHSHPVTVFILAPADSEDTALTSDYNIHLTVNKPSTPVLSEWLSISHRITALSVPTYSCETQESVAEFIRGAENLRTVTCAPRIAEDLEKELGGTEYDGTHTSLRLYPNVHLVTTDF